MSFSGIVRTACVAGLAVFAAPGRAEEAGGQVCPRGFAPVEVRSGDSLWSLARSHDTTVADLREANGLTDDRIVAGRTLCVPRAGGRAGSAAPNEAAAPPRPPAASDLPPPPDDVDTTTLPALLAEQGFVEPPGGFLAYVVEIAFDEARESIVGERRFDYAGTSMRRTGWNAASTVKLYVAAAALLRMRDLGFDPDAAIVFRGGGSEPSFTLRELVVSAVGPSDNLAYDYLAVFAGFDYLHGEFFSAAHGLEGTVLRVAYARGEWEEMGFDSFFRNGPAMTVSGDGRELEIPAANGGAEVDCSQAACTSPRELGEALRRIVLQEKLPPGESLGLHPDDLALLRDTLAGTRSRGEEAVRALRPFFGPDARVYHKAGYAGEWFTDNVLIDDPDLDRAWVIVLAGNPGRNALDEAARLVGELVSSGALDAPPPEDGDEAR